MDNTLRYGNISSYRLDKQSLQYAPASLQVRQESKIVKYIYHAYIVVL